MVVYVFLSVTVSLFTIFLWLKNKNADYWKKKNVVFVSKKNGFGVLWDFLIGDRSLAEIYKDVYDKHPTEPYVGMFLGSKPVLLLRDPENIESVFTSDFQSFNNRGIVTNPNDLLADSLLFMDDFRRWKLVRQKISPVFTISRLKNMFYIIEHSARHFVKFVEANKDLHKVPFNLLYTYTSAALGASVFGIDTKTENTMDSPFVDMAWKTVTPTFKANLRFCVANTFPSIFRWLRLKIFGKHENFFIGVVRKVLQERQNEKKKRHDFIDTCLELQKNGTMKDLETNFQLEPTDELLAAQAFFFFIAGADTSANTMNFTLIELANNQDILMKVHKEVDKVFDSCDDKLSYDRMKELQYLDMAIDEALRKYPPIGLIQRKCTQDTVLPVGNLKIEKDTVVITPVFAIQRDEKYFMNPDSYDPERFNPENLLKQVRYTYLPFGKGNRVCIGARFARLQVKAGLAWLLRRFTLDAQAHAPSKFEPSFVSLRATAVHYTLLPRDDAVDKKTE